jgi:hypothetical protein
MRLLVCNGSPRTGGSNTDLLLDAFLAGFGSGGGHTVARLHLARPAHLGQAASSFPDEEAVLLAFPLYVDAMPAPAKAFIEALAPYVGRPGNPALLFLVQSGFPEALHARPVERWLEKLAHRLGAPYLGSIVKGGVEGIRGRSPRMQRRILDPIAALGHGLGERGELDRALLARLARPERLPRGPFAFIPAAIARVLSKVAWDAMLRANGALAERDARPYAPAP